LNMSLSTQDALKLAKTNIDAAQEARGAKDRIKHYRIAKNASAKVDAVKTNTSSLRKMIAASKDLAVVLDNSGVQVQRKAAKCRQRAGALRQKLGRRNKTYDAIVASSLIGPGVPLAITQSIIDCMNTSASVSSSSGSITSTVTSINASAATSIKASAAGAVNTTISTTQQLAPPFPQATDS
ncbi:hypothetical protein BGZ51_008448, partial [Haplosporangium sp. Z 767]